MSLSKELYNEDGSVCFNNYAKAKLPVDQNYTIFCSCKVMETRFSNEKVVDCVRTHSVD